MRKVVTRNVVVAKLVNFSTRMQQQQQPWTWQQVQHICEQKQYHLLVRNPSSEDSYNARLQYIDQNFVSIKDFVLHAIFEHQEMERNSQGKIQIVEPVQPGVRLRLNDFPYFFEKNIDHFVLWSFPNALTQQQAHDYLEQKFGDMSKVLYFCNPAHLQSVKAVPHYQVMVKKD